MEWLQTFQQPSCKEMLFFNFSFIYTIFKVRRPLDEHTRISLSAHNDLVPG